MGKLIKASKVTVADCNDEAAKFIVLLDSTNMNFDDFQKVFEEIFSSCIRIENFKKLYEMYEDCSDETFKDITDNYNK